MDFEYTLDMEGKKTARKGTMELKDILKELNEKLGNNGKISG